MYKNNHHLISPLTALFGRLTALCFALMTAASMSVLADESAEARNSAKQTEATRAVALPFLHSLFSEGQLHGAYEQYADPDFIQHNPDMPDGIEGRRAFFEEKAKNANGKTGEWANVTNMIIVDGDLFAVHHHAFAGPDDPGRVFVDIWRVADGRIVEHWDVIQPIPAEQAHDNGMACGKGDDFASAKALGDSVEHPTCGWPDTTISREQAIETVDNYALALKNTKDAPATLRQWLTEDYKQHGPDIGDGVEGAIAFLQEIYGKGPDALPNELGKRVMAEGDYVLFHRLVKYPGRELSTNVDIFRIRDGQIAEHWDIKQPVPDTAANDNGTW